MLPIECVYHCHSKAHNSGPLQAFWDYYTTKIHDCYQFSNLNSRRSLRLCNSKAETSTNTFDIIVIDAALLHQLEDSSDVGEGQGEASQATKSP